MTKIMITAIIVLFAAGVHAQLGMPKELTCTEEAFNFSFSVGANWKLITPKMGPVGVIKDDPYYSPALDLKVNSVLPKTDLSPLFEARFNFGALHDAVNQQSLVPLSTQKGLSVLTKSSYLLPVINFNPSINDMLKPNFQPVQIYPGFW